MDHVAHQGIWPALLTPMDSCFHIRNDLLTAHSKRLIGAGCAGVTLFGTTGEGPSFSVSERMAALEALIAGGVPASRILVHTSASALPDAIALCNHATALGVHACLLMPPFFFKGVSDDGLVYALSAVFEAVLPVNPDFRVVLYHIPQVSGLDVSTAVVDALTARYPQVVIGIKDSACDEAHSLVWAHRFHPSVQVWVGNEMDLQAMASVGSYGAVSGIANILPHDVAQLLLVPNSQVEVKAVADSLARVSVYLDLLNEHGMLPTFKATMAYLSGDDDWLNVRAPLMPLSVSVVDAVKASLLRLDVHPLVSNSHATV
jgi:4-hydroxy-tetrahydrodipicolinate synthase